MHLHFRHQNSIGVLLYLFRILFSELSNRAKSPAIFLDRDGVINRRRPGDYILNWSQFVFIDGIRTALKHLASLQLPIIVISNQACVGKGLLAPADLEEITRRMYQSLVADGAPLVAAYYCIHRADEHCPCRKPKPALLQSAANDFNIDLSRSVFVGDSDTDMLAAEAAGCAAVLFQSDDDLHKTSSTSILTAHRVTEIFTLVVNNLQGTVRA